MLQGAAGAQQSKVALQIHNTAAEQLTFLVLPAFPVLLELLTSLSQYPSLRTTCCLMRIVIAVCTQQKIASVVTTISTNA